eukprot:Plantae.Rhodophyta-Palmaria_palmata.ctg6257.p1 GENE.Plantae.Rhodophyta-Palmaria_palmata.ctg6257~~Plantae.Rhodophyta-Palmaria_palmata.ctg6257.p1  ORF type:complete len:236 (+),score=41.32 Plantae.Rhodophyta-Palmaria_palmata.ctg6257:42-710(+)
MQDVEPGETDNIILLAEHKQASSFCGCCCDMRRGVMFVNLVYMIIAFVSFIHTSQVVQEGQDAMKEYDAQDEFVQELTDMLVGGDFDAKITELDNALLSLNVIMVASLLFSALSVGGSMYYNFWAVVVGALFNLVAFFAACSINVSLLKDGIIIQGDLILMYAAPLAGTLFHSYPNAVFAYQLKKGLMSKERYPYEKHCCCDGSGVARGDSPSGVVDTACVV